MVKLWRAAIFYFDKQEAPYMRKATTPAIKAPLRQRLKVQLQWYSFILPTIICLAVLTYAPLVQCIRYSLYRVNVIGFGEKFVGLKNYIGLLSGTGFPRALKNTLILAVYSLIVIPLGFMLASVLHTLGRSKTQAFFRVMFYMPNIITGVSVVLLFRYVLMQDGGARARCMPGMRPG